MRIFLLAVGDRSRASSRLRVWDHLDWLAGQGHQVVADFVLPPGVQRITLPVALRILARWPLWAWQFLRADRIVIQEALLLAPLLALKRFGKLRRVVFDFSDPVDAIGSGLRNRLQRLGFATMTRLADHVQVENNAYLADLHARGIGVSQFYGPVDARRYGKSAAGVKRPTDPRSPLRIGWTGSPGTLSFIEPLFPVLDDLALTHSIELMLIGVTQVDFKFKHLKVLPTPWTEPEEFRLVPSFQLGLFALDGSEESKRRGAGKLFVYMASGVPFIASGIGIAVDVMQDSAAGFLVAGPQDWRATLAQAISNPSARQAMAARGSRAAETRMSYEVYRKNLLTDLLQA